MRTVGIDVGSRTVKIVLAEDGRILLARKKESTFAVIDVCRELLDGLVWDGVTATGYGRHLVREYFGCAEDQ